MTAADSEWFAWAAWGAHETAIDQAEKHNSVIESDQPQGRKNQ